MERAEENNNKRENITNGGANREDQRVKDGIYKNSNDNHHQHRKSKETSSFHHLRNEKIAMILETAILDIMDYAKAKKLPGILLFTEFEKAFNSLEWTFLERCLNQFGFGPDFQDGSMSSIKIFKAYHKQLIWLLLSLL